MQATEVKTGSARRGAGDSGGAGLLTMAATAALTGALLLALGDLGAVVVDRTRARTAADGAALAGLEGGRSEAARIARLHGAELVSWHEDIASSQVTVVVSVDGVAATARASNAP